MNPGMSPISCVYYYSELLFRLSIISKEESNWKNAYRSLGGLKRNYKHLGERPSDLCLAPRWNPRPPAPRPTNASQHRQLRAVRLCSPAHLDPLGFTNVRDLQSFSSLNQKVFLIFYHKYIHDNSFTINHFSL